MVSAWLLSADIYIILVISIHISRYANFFIEHHGTWSTLPLIILLDEAPPTAECPPGSPNMAVMGGALSD